MATATDAGSVMKALAKHLGRVVALQMVRRRSGSVEVFICVAMSENSF